MSGDAIMPDTNVLKAGETDSAMKPDTEQHSTSTEKSQEANGQKSAGNINDFTKKAVGKGLGSQYATENYGNVETQNVFNIYEMKGDISMVRKISGGETASDDRQYRLNERQECSIFVKNYQVSMHLAYAITASVYEYVPVGDLPFLSRSLLERFDALPYREKEYDKNGNEIFRHRSELISVDDISGIIGTSPLDVTFTTRFEDITERCISYDNALRESVRNNLWSAFPGIRGVITSWLIQTDFSHSYRNALSTTCLVKAVYNIVKMDFGDAMSTLFPQLESNDKNKYLMIRIMMLLSEDEATKKNACALLKQWASSPEWLWEISLVVFSQTNEELPFVNELERTLAKKLANDYDKDWGGWSTYFVAGQMMDSLRLRNLVSQILHKLITKNNRSNDEYSMAVIFMLLVSNAYQFVDENSLALSLVAIDSEKQLEDIQPLLCKIFSDYDLRHSLFEVLGAYLAKLDGYNFTTKRLMNQLKSFFYVVAKKSERFNGDIQRFLARLQNKGNGTAKQISAFLQDKIPSNKEPKTCQD